MYYWTLLHKPNNELVKKVFDAQIQFATKNDWINQIENDLKILNIEKNEKEIKSMKKSSFKKLIKEKLRMVSTNYLFTYKPEEKRSKIKNLKSYKLQNYLKSTTFTNKEKKLLFSLRTRTVDVKSNYKNKYLFNLNCRLCDDKTEIESEEHYLKCKQILQNLEDTSDIVNARYDNIFNDNIEEQLVITKVFDKVFKLRRKLLNV